MADPPPPLIMKMIMNMIMNMIINMAINMTIKRLKPMRVLPALKSTGIFLFGLMVIAACADREASSVRGQSVPPPSVTAPSVTVGPEMAAPNHVPDHGPDHAPLPPACALSLMVLGAGQDAGAPQIGYTDDPAWEDPALALSASSIAVIDHGGRAAYLFDATPDIARQIQRLHRAADLDTDNLGLGGIFLTHAHIGHYAGLMFLGREAASTRAVPVYAMARMAAFLRDNGPWGQLVSLKNITLRPLDDNVAVSPVPGLSVTPLTVPHRDEYSETVGFLIAAPGRRVLYLPDIDSWSQWESAHGRRLSEVIAGVDLAFIDATFFDDNELPGRDMSLIPHPRVTTSMDLLRDVPAPTRAGVHFIHYNHTNPIRFPASHAERAVADRGFSIARAGMQFCLDPDE